MGALFFFFFSREEEGKRNNPGGGGSSMSDLYLSVPLCSDYDFYFFPFCMYAMLIF